MVYKICILIVHDPILCLDIRLPLTFSICGSCHSNLHARILSSLYF